MPTIFSTIIFLFTPRKNSTINHEQIAIFSTTKYSNVDYSSKNAKKALVNNGDMRNTSLQSQTDRARDREAPNTIALQATEVLFRYYLLFIARNATILVSYVD